MMVLRFLAAASSLASFRKNREKEKTVWLRCFLKATQSYGEPFGVSGTLVCRSVFRPKDYRFGSEDRFQPGQGVHHEQHDGEPPPIDFGEVQVELNLTRWICEIHHLAPPFS